MTMGMWRHKSCLDIDLCVIGVVEGLSDFSVTIKYWNRYYLLFQGEREDVVIKKENIHLWEKI